MILTAWNVILVGAYFFSGAASAGTGPAIVPDKDQKMAV